MAIFVSTRFPAETPRFVCGTAVIAFQGAPFHGVPPGRYILQGWPSRFGPGGRSTPFTGIERSKPLTIEPIGIAVPASDPLLLNLVQNYMRAMEASGVLEQLNNKWFQDASWLIQLP